MKNLSKKILSALVLGSLVSCANAFAQEEAIGEFELDQMVVTATRTEKHDVDVPMSTEIITAEDIKRSGAHNLLDALSKTSGIAYKQFGPAGSSMGTMCNEINIRGIDNGTLILVNGAPATWRGKSTVEAIPADSIERVEIVKGGGSVLYGSEAMAGVVNIITKQKADNKVYVGIGNRGQKIYGLNVGNDKFVVNYEKEKWDGSVNNTTFSEVKSGTKVMGETTTNVSDIRRENLGLRYNITDNLFANYNYYYSSVRYSRVLTQSEKKGVSIGDPFNYRDYITKQHIANINYSDKNWKAKIFMNSSTVESDGFTWLKSSLTADNSIYNTREKNVTYGLDVQRDFKLSKKADMIVGFNFTEEKYNQLATKASPTTADYSRHNWAVFAQLDQKFDDKNSMILGARETWSTGAFQGKNHSNFSGSASFIHKFDEKNNIYATVAQTFIMPTFAQMYKSTDVAIPNPNLKPQKGINYEIGWKRIHNNHSWKAALFKTNISDNISAVWEKGLTEYQYTNEDFKNIGLELSCEIEGKGPWSFNYNLLWHNPQVKASGEGSKKDYWDRKFGRYQIGGGVNYKMKKFQASLQGTFLGNRVQTPSSSQSYSVHPYFLTTLSAQYAPDKNSEFSLTMDNILNRRDVLSHSSSAYYATPFNFMLRYTYKF